MGYVDGTACVLGIQKICFETSLSISDWAAWAQALGGVVGVFAAVWIVGWQLRHERGREREEEARRTFVLWTLVYHARAALEHAKAGFENNIDAFYIPESLIRNAAALEAIPIFDMPGHSAVVAVQTVVGAYKTFTEGVRGRSSPFDRAAAECIRAYGNAIEDNLRFAEVLLRRELNRCGWSERALQSKYTINGIDYPPLQVA